MTKQELQTVLRDDVLEDTEDVDFNLLDDDDFEDR